MLFLLLIVNTQLQKKNITM